MPLPNFLIVGAARSATTSLHYYLQEHPEVCMSSTKEPNYFLCDRRTSPTRLLIQPDRRLEAKSTFDRGRYEALFVPKESEWRIGEASPLYLYARETPALIAAELPQPPELIAVLRNPIDRAYSHFLHTYRGRPDMAVSSFAAAIQAELPLEYEPYRTGTHFLRLGLYAAQVRRYLDMFDASKMLVVLHDDLVAAPSSTMAKICSFLGVDGTFQFRTDTVYNPSGVSHHRASRVFRRTTTRLQPWVKRLLPAGIAGNIGRLRALYERPGEPPDLPNEIRTTLVNYYRADVRDLEELLGRDLSHWLST